MPAPTSRLLACATTIAVAVGLLAGCTGGSATADPTGRATSTGGQASPGPSASPTPSATVAAPQWTAAMDEVSVEGAQAVGQYFLELFPYVHATGDTSAWRALSHSECVFCADVARGAEDPPEGGYANGTVTVQAVQGVELDPGSVYSLNYTMEYASEGASTAERDTVLMIVVRESDHWLVRAVDLKAADGTGA
ncbi:DUF6318 family protein [Cellulomonas soli]